MARYVGGTSNNPIRKFPGRELMPVNDNNLFTKNSERSRFNGKEKYTQPRKFPGIREPMTDDARPHNCIEVLEVLRSIQSLIQCEKCHKPMKVVRTCLNGHGVCGPCKDQCHKACPTCKAIILETQPALLSSIANLLPTECKYMRDGCDIILLPSNSGHEVFCKFRKVFCRMAACVWKGLAKDLLYHLESTHGKDLIRVASLTQTLVGFNTREDREGIAVIVAFNNIFWCHVKVQNMVLMQSYQYVPMTKPTHTYTVRVTFQTPDQEYSKVTPVLTDEFARQVFKAKDTFRLPKKIAGSFSRSGKCVNYTFTVAQHLIPGFKHFEATKKNMQNGH